MTTEAPTSPEYVRAFHAAYVRETGLTVSLGFDRQRTWHTLLSLQFGEPPAFLTVADLVMVIRHLRIGISKGERNHGCLRFRNLIEQPDYFEEELAMARKIAGLRKPQPARAVPVLTPLPNGGSVTRLDERKPEREPVEASDEVRRAMAENLRNFTARISGK